MSDTKATRFLAFLRGLNMVLKSARLYGFEHERTSEQFTSAWNQLRAALEASAGSGLLLGISGSQLLLDSEPLKGGPAEQSFAKMLSTAGLASLEFTPQATRDEFADLVRAFAKGGPKEVPVADSLKDALPAGSGIRLNQVRYVAEDASLGEVSPAAQLVARTLEATPEMKAWLTDPQKLLQLIVAAEGAQSGGAAPSGSAGVGAGPASAGREKVSGGVAPAAAPREDDILGLMRLLGQLSQGQQQPGRAPSMADFQQQMARMPGAARAALEQALSKVAATPGAKSDRNFLLQLAEDLAIRFALERYQKGNVQVDAVRQTLDRMNRELETLRRTAGVREEKPAYPGVAADPEAELLDRKFWASVPDEDKRSVLLSPEAWSVPSRNIRQFVEQHINRGHTHEAATVLENYAACVASAELYGRRKAAAGLRDLGEFYLRVGGKALGAALTHTGAQLGRESDPEIQSLLTSAFIQLSQEVARQHNYPILLQALDALEKLEHDHPALGHSLRPRLGVENRVADFLDHGLKAPAAPEGLVEVLRHLPRPAIENLTARIKHCERRVDRDHIVELAKALGPEAAKHLRDVLRTRPASEGAYTVGLLSLLDVPALQELVPGQLRAWSRFYHDVVVRQIASAGAPERGRLLLEWYDLLDSLVLPETIDEIGMSGDRDAVPHLLRLAGGEQLQSGNAYLQVKALEALGRFRETSAAPLLHRLVEAKQFWRWAHPHELRVVAAQVLEKIEPEWMEKFLPGSDLDPAELRLVPLDPDPDSSWMLQRRYQRIVLPEALDAVASTQRGKCSLSVKTMSLCGGRASSANRMQPGAEADLEIHHKLRRIRAHVLIREMPPPEVAFEIVDIDLEERSRLRKLLAGVQPRAE